MISAARRGKLTFAIDTKIDPAGFLRKQAGGRLPKDLSSITTMKSQLWKHIWTPVWNKTAEWLQSQQLDATVQSYISSEHLGAFGSFLQKGGLTHADITNLQTLLGVKLSFLRS
jgi:hypothetical protein